MTAAAALELTAAVAVDAPPAQVSTDSRTITGVVVVWDVVGRTSVGPTIFTPGSIEWPDDLKRVKLLLDHDHSRPAGYLRSLSPLADGSGLLGTFYCPPGPVGDLALSQARDGLRDALSVGVHVDNYDPSNPDGVLVLASRGHEVSLVAIPAFDATRVTKVTAARKEATSVDNDDTTTTTTETTETTTTETVEAPPETVETTTTTETVEANPSASDVEASQTTRAAVRTAATVTRARVAPFGLTAMASMVANHLKAQGSAAAIPGLITAALSDVTPNNLSTTAYGPTRPQYVNDLWQAADVARPTVDAFGPTRKLTGLKVHGWVWETRPKVQRYSGNKSDVPSNAIKRVRQENTAQRFAGGWDVDRVFVDLPSETDEVADIFTEATISYKEESEVWAAELVNAAATPLYGAAVSVPGALAIVGSYFAKLKGARVGYIAMGTEAWDDFVNMTGDAAPWWLKSLGTLSLTENSGEAAGLRFVVNPDMAPTEVMAADKRAARFWEIDPPIRVQAQDIPRGGVDLGVFGYMAGMVTDPRAIISVDTAGRTVPTP